jgi:hypothetical protein
MRPGGGGWLLRHLSLLARQQVPGALRLNRPQPVGVVGAPGALQRLPPLELIHACEMGAPTLARSGSWNSFSPAAHACGRCRMHCLWHMHCSRSHTWCYHSLINGIQLDSFGSRRGFWRAVGLHARGGVVDDVEEEVVEAVVWVVLPRSVSLPDRLQLLDGRQIRLRGEPCTTSPRATYHKNPAAPVYLHAAMLA